MCRFIRILSIIFILFISNGVLFSREHEGESKKTNRTSSQDKITFGQFDISNITSWVSTNGQIVSHIPTGRNSGLEWPKGSKNYAVYASGPWVVGKVDGEIRSAAAEFSTEFVAGPLGGDPFSPRNKIFRVSPEFPEGLDINGDGDFDDTFDDLRNAGISSQTGEFDPWSAWPVENGAPVDENGDPKIMGDGMVWMVFNDGDPDAHDNLWRTEPLGLEVQLSLFGFEQDLFLQDIMFCKWLYINKGGNPIDSTYFGMWSDPDVGTAGNDLVAVDTTTDLGFTYNGTPVDGVYGSTPPAVGYDVLQAPLVPSAGDVGYAFGREITGFRNLPIAAFSKYIGGGPVQFEDPERAVEAFNFLRGKDKLGRDIINPVTGLPEKFIHAADPVAGTGWLDMNPGDRRFLMSFGPFTMAPGDSQEVVVAVILARGTDNLNSITKLRFLSAFAQAAFDNNFQFPTPVVPTLEIAELDQELVLTWDKNHEMVEQSFGRGYDFEGYNIYQGETPDGPWTRIATVDVDNAITLVVDKVLDEDTGIFLEELTAFGSDSGIQRFYQVEDDVIGGDIPFINNRKYYFAVTSYLVDIDGFPKVLESPIVGKSALPHEASLGDVLNSEFGQLLSVEHTQGLSFADVSAIVVNPESITGDRYRVTFNENESWNLINLNSNDTILQNQTDFGGLANDIGEGLLVTVEGSFEPPTTFDSEQFVVDADPSDPGLDLWFDGTAFGPNGDVASVSGEFPRAATEFLQLDIELRFTGIPSDQSSLQASIDSPIIAGGQWGTYYEQSVATGATSLPADLSGRQWNPVRLAFELWDVENERQVNCIVLNRNADGAAPYGATAGDPNTPGMEPRYRISGRDYIIPMMTDYDAQFAQSNRLGWDGTDPETGRPNSDFTTWFLFFHQGGVENGDTWTTGDVFQLTYDNPILPGVDEFEFDTPANVRDDRELALSQIDKINVFPNPYMGFNLEAPDLSRRFVRFTHLAGLATIRIFTISGRIVRVLEHDGSSQFCEWDLTNEQGRLVASGVYLVQVDLHTLGAEKLLKLAVFQPRQ